MLQVNNKTKTIYNSEHVKKVTLKINTYLVN